MSEDPRGTLVIGLGTGRCGTNSLAALLDLQTDAAVTHERFGHGLHWEGGLAQVDALIAAVRADLRSGLRLAGDVHSAYLPYAERLLSTRPAVRMVCLQRDRDATVASFESKTHRKANHWAPTRPFSRHARWNACFPTYPAELPKPEAIARYWDEYYREAERLQARDPDRFRVVPMTDLNSEAGQRSILGFVGIAAADQRVADDLHLNEERPRRHGLAKLLDWF